MGTRRGLLRTTDDRHRERHGPVGCIVLYRWRVQAVSNHRHTEIVEMERTAVRGDREHQRRTSLRYAVPLKTNQHPRGQGHGSNEHLTEARQAFTRSVAHMRILRSAGVGPYRNTMGRLLPPFRGVREVHRNQGGSPPLRPQPDLTRTSRVVSGQSCFL